MGIILGVLDPKREALNLRGFFIRKEDGSGEVYARVVSCLKEVGYNVAALSLGFKAQG